MIETEDKPQLEEMQIPVDQKGAFFAVSGIYQSLHAQDSSRFPDLFFELSQPSSNVIINIGLRTSITKEELTEVIGKFISWAEDRRQNTALNEEGIQVSSSYHIRSFLLERYPASNPDISVTEPPKMPFSRVTEAVRTIAARLR